jgi:hypothetical protein
MVIATSLGLSVENRNRRQKKIDELLMIVRFIVVIYKVSLIGP